MIKTTPPIAATVGVVSSMLLLTGGGILVLDYQRHVRSIWLLALVLLGMVVLRGFLNYAERALINSQNALIAVLKAQWEQERGPVK